MNETIRKFGWPDTLVREFDHWVVLARPAQPTLGSLVLAAKSDVTAFGDLPADVDVRTAAFWAAEAGHRVAHTAVHVHGGVGIDTDHPVHRYFLAAKQTEFASGSATGQLLVIGRELADTPA